MSTPFDLFQSVWWRFNRYVTKDGYIRPAPNAKLEIYDPWKSYRESWVDDPDSATPFQEKRQTSPPYISLLSLLEEIDFAPSGDPTSKSAEKITDWCSEYGLLGMLSQKVLMVSMALRWMSEWWSKLGSDPFPFADGKFHPCAYQFTRVNSVKAYRGWSPTFYMDEKGELGRQEGEIVKPNTKLRSGPWRSFALVQNIFLLVDEEDGSQYTLVTGDYSEETLSETWGKFFPDVPDDEKETFFYPLPNSDEFWSIYGESIKDFITGALVLREGIDQLNPEYKPDKLYKGRSLKLNHLLSPVGIVLNRDENGSVYQQWWAPSLLSSFAAMAAQDLTQQRKVLGCDNCNKPFVTDAYQARYCSDKCRRTMQKRRYREKLKEKASHEKKETRGRITTIAKTAKDQKTRSR
jgi:hypothetical protein